MVHLTPEKTAMIFKKVRRNFNELAVFVDYQHGNVRINLLNDNTARLLGGRLIEIPIYHTKFVANNLQELPNEYKIFFNLQK
jgi:hypothetical protein